MSSKLPSFRVVAFVASHHLLNFVPFHYCAAFEFAVGKHDLSSQKMMNQGLAISFIVSLVHANGQYLPRYDFVFWTTQENISGGLRPITEGFHAVLPA